MRSATSAVRSFTPSWRAGTATRAVDLSTDAVRAMHGDGRRARVPRLRGPRDVQEGARRLHLDLPREATRGRAHGSDAAAVHRCGARAGHPAHRLSLRPRRSLQQARSASRGREASGRTTREPHAAASPVSSRRIWAARTAKTSPSKAGSSCRRGVDASRSSTSATSRSSRRSSSMIRSRITARPTRARDRRRSRSRRRRAS